MTILKSKAMEQALAEAQKAAELGEIPVGAVILDKKGIVIATGHNRVLLDHDPTAHAEIVAIRSAARFLKNERLTDCQLFVTLEPCAMCAQAIAFARIARLYYAAEDAKGGAVAHGPRIFSQSTVHHRPEIYSGLYAARAGQLLQTFFQARRSVIQDAQLSMKNKEKF